MNLLLSSIVMEVIREFQISFMKKSHIQKKHKKQKKNYISKQKRTAFFCALKKRLKKKTYKQTYA